MSEQQAVIIKSSRSGLQLFLDPDIPFSELRNQVIEKFKAGGNFFKDADMALTFRGRKLSEIEEQALVNAISDHSSVRIICIIDENELREEYMHSQLAKQLEEENDTSNEGQFYKGTLRSGQILESESSIIILGDVNPGANVISRGNVVVLGALKGTVFAGASGRDTAFVAALSMSPVQIRIADVIARSADKSIYIDKEKDSPMDPRIAYVEDGHIYVEPLTKESLNDIRL